MDTTTNGEEIVFVCTEVIDAPVEPVEWETPEEMIAAHQEVKDAAVKKLTKLGLTLDEARALIGNI